MNKNTLALLSLVATSLLTTSCHEYYDDLQGIGERVVALEEKSPLKELQEDMLFLQKLVAAAGEHDCIVSFKENDDNSYSIAFASDPDNFFTLRQGVAGEDGTDGVGVEIGVAQGPDGEWYWTVNGDRTSMKVAAIDGTDGRDGTDGTDGTNGTDRTKGNTIMPVFRVSDEGYWMYSLDNGQNWMLYTDSLGKPVAANGKDGAPDKWFQRVYPSSDGKYLIFELKDGTKIWAPLSAAAAANTLGS